MFNDFGSLAFALAILASLEAKKKQDEECNRNMR